MEITIGRLPEDEWNKYREIRLECLKNDSIAFGSSYEEEKDHEESVWRSRIKDALFALDEKGNPVGVMAFLFNSRVKTKHRADIYSVYIRPEYRGKKIGIKLFEEALRLIKLNKDVVKINLTVNPLQKPAVKLYEHYGFKNVGKLSKELLIDGVFYDEVLMELIL
jgi:ribosomal protein S18 acetylase RimI-like enzyme